VLAGPRLWFAPFHPHTRLADNRFGIPEPVASRRQACPLLALDIVLMPLVAFDGRGNRLGMGGGYYDRTFASRAHRTHLRRPLLVGAAFAFQRREHLEARPWDVALDAAITDRGFEWLR
jgi:5-formyltetrahydrofolate cyclo-ligase